MSDPDYMQQFFKYEHLPPHLQAVSKPFGDLAAHIVEKLPKNPERTVALRKLLEAKDCAVRALIATMTALILCLTGCSAAEPTPDTGALVAVELVAASLVDDAPQPTPDSKSICDNCHGTGKLGDGRVSVQCPVCGGTGRLPKAGEIEPVRCSLDDCDCERCPGKACECDAFGSAPDYDAVPDRLKPDEITVYCGVAPAPGPGVYTARPSAYWKDGTVTRFRRRDGQFWPVEGGKTQAGSTECSTGACSSCSRSRRR